MRSKTSSPDLLPLRRSEAKGKKESEELREKSHCLSVINLHARARPRYNLQGRACLATNQPSVVNRRVNAITHKTKTERESRRERGSIQRSKGASEERGGGGGDVPGRNAKSAVIWLIIANHVPLRSAS